LLDQAEQVLEHGNLEDDGSFVKFNKAGFALERAGVLIHFQHIQEARSALESARAQPGVDLPRWQTRLLLAEAQVFFAENSLEGCYEKAVEALSLLQTTRSQSGLWRMTNFYQQLSMKYSQHALVQMLGEQIEQR
jgi:hypothetical protein